MNAARLAFSVLLGTSVSVLAATQVRTESDLRNISGAKCSDDITLMNDIRMSNSSFTPLCPNGFSGVFDGGNHTITNLYISEDLVYCKKVAFIAVLSDGGVLKNLTFKDPRVEAYNIIFSVKEASVAVAVGELEGGSVENVHVIGGNVDVSSMLLNNATADAGGLVGTADSGAVSESGGEIDVSNTGSRNGTVGGICGSITGDVTLTSVTYSGNVAETVGSVDEDATLTSKYGAVTLSQTRSANSAVIDGEYTGKDSIKIPTDVSVNSVVLTRNFVENTMSTLMLPFSIDTSKVKGAKIYRFKRVDVNEETGIWKVVIGRIYTPQLGANTPYLVLPTADKMTFEGPVTFNTTTSPLENVYGLEEGSSWEFKGVYAHTNFDEVYEDGEMYAFAGQNRDGVKVGQFKKIGSGVKAYPMQAYLVNHEGSVAAKSASASFGHGFALPDVIDIEIEDENGVVVEAGKLNTVTGEGRMDRWFDLKGRKLNSRPSVKGTYYKNGRRVIIK